MDAPGTPFLRRPAVLLSLVPIVLLAFAVGFLAFAVDAPVAAARMSATASCGPPYQVLLHEGPAYDNPPSRFFTASCAADARSLGYGALVCVALALVSLLVLALLLIRLLRSYDAAKARGAAGGSGKNIPPSSSALHPRGRE